MLYVLVRSTNPTPENFQNLVTGWQGPKLCLHLLKRKEGRPHAQALCIHHSTDLPSGVLLSCSITHVYLTSRPGRRAITVGATPPLPCFILQKSRTSTFNTDSHVPLSGTTHPQQHLTRTEPCKWHSGCRARTPTTEDTQPARQLLHHNTTTWDHAPPTQTHHAYTASCRCRAQAAGTTQEGCLVRDQTKPTPKTPMKAGATLCCRAAARTTNC
jgi:hypothetical protein